ncbi:MAG: Coenzyme F420 hydrogenase/dehydrogenase, beta subunit C-terminal domain [Candidatus Omnitrophica bacterium]|nr:Coenzyme F420 hydrogenase/dehydrogenase, beta subunit C-terminal domain [Candidatus Omnitrophota bacterium]
MKPPASNKKDVSFVTQNSLCYSCGACSVCCAAEAISFKVTNSGLLHPVIDYKLCNSCGICLDVCPAYHDLEIFPDKYGLDNLAGQALCCFLGRSLDEKIFANSQSGGLVTETLSFLFESRLITSALVVKMDYAVTPKPEPLRVYSPEELFQSQKSFYAPVALLSALKDIEKMEGNLAMVGLPCHIHGLKSLVKVNQKLFGRIKYKLGLLCGGTLSFLASNYFSQRTKIKHRIIYRNKKYPNFEQAHVTLQLLNGQILVIPREQRFWLKEILTPPRCLLCADKMNLYADLVFGDPWGLPNYDQLNGDSVVISRTETGQKIANSLVRTGKVRLQKVNYDEIIKGQELAKRIKMALSCASVYKEIGLALPDSLSTITLPEPELTALRERIDLFLRLQERPLEDNLRLINRIILSKRWKQKITTFVSRLR